MASLDARRDQKKVTNDSFTLPNKFYLTKTAVKSTPGLALVEVHPPRAVGLAGLQPDVRRDLENIVNDSLHHPKQNLFAIYSAHWI